MKKYFIIAFVVSIVIAFFALHFHNATVYQPKHGFDGVGHVWYIEYIAKNNKIPAPESGWETHQSPLYYVLGAGLMKLSGTSKTAQYINTFVLAALIGVVGLGLWRVFKKKEPVFVGMLSLAALPMLAIFPSMVSNELLSAFFMISVAVSCIFLVTAKSKRELLWNVYILFICITFGFWTKVTMITMAPTVLVAVLMVLFSKKSVIKKKQLALLLVVCGATALLLGSLVFLRVQGTKTPSNLANIVGVSSARTPDFFYRMDWIPKVDMYTTQYYSMWGGAFNSFFNDGHNAVTPFIQFHKKAFILWSLGFLLLPLSIFGLVKLWKSNIQAGPVIYAVGLSMLLLYVYFNYRVNHYSGVRLTYQMPIVLAYAFGLAGASQWKWFRLLVPLLLLLQFIILVSFYWIQPFWHVTR